MTDLFEFSFEGQQRMGGHATTSRANVQRVTADQTPEAWKRDPAGAYADWQEPAHTQHPGAAHDVEQRGGLLRERDHRR